jgi:hypothetical protein
MVTFPPGAGRAPSIAVGAAPPATRPE